MEAKKENKKSSGSPEQPLPNDGAAPLRYTFKLPIPLKDLREDEAALQKMLGKAERELSVDDIRFMTEAQRRRLLGSGVRRFGFIVKTFELASDNQDFVPPFLDMQNFADLIDEINATRNIVVSLEQLLRTYNDVLLVAGDDAFRLALMYYTSVRDAARRGVPGAQAIFRTLELFFRRGRRADDEPTDQEVITDAEALLHGRKDGEIIIKGHAAQASAGSHEVVDNTYKPTGNLRAKIVCSQCSTENENHAKFCINCGAKL